MRLTFQEVLNCPINTSKSKQAHAFPKAQRFNDRHHSPCFRDSYDLSPLMMSQQIRRRDRTAPQSARSSRSETISPGPAAYNTFTPNSPRAVKNGPTFDQAKRLSTTAREVPGPGAYSPYHEGRRGGGYSMGLKLVQDLTRSAVGPGQYYTERYNTINGDNPLISKYTRPQGCRISKEERFHEPFKLVTPAPDQYNSAGERGGKGSFAFGREERKSFVVDRWGTPGPGQYLEFSEFAQRRRQLEHNLKRMQRLVKK